MSYWIHPSFHILRDDIRTVTSIRDFASKEGRTNFLLSSSRLPVSRWDAMKILFSLKTLRDMCTTPQEQKNNEGEKEIWILFQRNELERWIYYECDSAFRRMNISEWINKSFLHLIRSHDINSRFIVHVVSHSRFSAAFCERLFIGEGLREMKIMKAVRVLWMWVKPWFLNTRDLFRLTDRWCKRKWEKQSFVEHK